MFKEGALINFYEELGAFFEEMDLAVKICSKELQLWFLPYMAVMNKFKMGKYL